MPHAAQSIVHIDDDRFRVTEWRFAPGAETGWHVHGHDYIIVPVTDGDMALEEPGGVQRSARLTQHQPYSRRAGVNHNVVNAGAAPMAFLEVEALEPPHAEARRATQAAVVAALAARDADAALGCLDPSAELRLPAGITDLAGLLAGWPDGGSPDKAHHLMDGDDGISLWRQGGTGAVDLCCRLRFDGARAVLLDLYARPAG
ncbi:MAG: cupin domain-containing protein [Alkalilacustris sp.]